MGRQKKPAGGNSGKNETTPKSSVSSASAPQKSRWNFGALLALTVIVAGICFAIFGRQEEVTPPTPSDEVATETPALAAYAPLRPTWMRPSHSPTGAERQRYTKLVRIAAGESRPYYGEACGNDPQCAHVLQARDAILARPAPSHAWAWEEVRQALHELGATIPILRAREQPAECSAFYIFALQSLAICTNHIAAVPASMEVDLESLLVHEMTHAVHLRRLTATSGFSAMEFAVIQNLCRDVNTNARVASEGIAFWNQGAYLRAYGPAETALPRDPTTVAAYRVVGGDERDRATFVREFMTHAGFGLQNAPPRIERCGQMVMVRGEHAGEYFFASDVFPEIVPLLELIPSLGPR